MTQILKNVINAWTFIILKNNPVLAKKELSNFAKHILLIINANIVKKIIDLISTIINVWQVKS